MEEIESETKKPKGKKIIGIILIVLLLAGLGYVCYLKFFSNKKDSEVSISEKEIYEATIDAYGDAVTFAIDTYIDNNSGKVPKWEDIEDNIHTLKDRVSCDHTINYDGSLYLEKCTVEGIKYTSNYTYGKKLPEPIKNYGVLYIYKTTAGNGYVITSAEYSTEYYQYVASYRCQSEECDGYTVSQTTNEAIIYDNDTYYLFNYTNEELKEIKLGNEKYSQITIIGSKKANYGLYVVKSNYKGAFYNLKNKEYVSDFIYGNCNNYDVDELLDNGYFSGTLYNENDGASKVVVIDSNSGGQIKVFDNAFYIKSTTVDNEVIYIIGNSPNSSAAQLYKHNFEELIDDKTYNYDINSNETITVYDMNNQNKFMVYSSKGELIKESNVYKQIIKVIKDYVIILDDEDNLKLFDDEENEITTFLKVTSEYQLHPMISGWYTENGKNGIYMIVENKNIPYGELGSGLEYYYIPSTGETGVLKNKGVGGYAKPVLYLYPTKMTKINISFEKPYLLTTTYPKYTNNWNVTAYPNGDLYDSNNKYYYGLYWEESGSSNITFDEGFYVTKENAIEFLEAKTSEIGFTRREANEFIMYWLPILEKNGKNLVYFELTEEREAYNKLNINPKPDSLLRVAIHVKKVDQKVKIKEQKITKFKRVGFTVVEWGGVEH